MLHYEAAILKLSGQPSVAAVAQHLLIARLAVILKFSAQQFL